MKTKEECYDEKIREEAIKAANRSQFKSNHIYDHKSYEDGFYEGMKLYSDQFRKPLHAAGAVALSARLVTNSNAKDISLRIEQMERALDIYDNEILSTINNGGDCQQPVSCSLPCHHNFIQKDTYWKSCTHCGMLEPLRQ